MATRIVSRDDAAQMLDVTVHEMRRRQAAKQLKVVKRGARGQVFYDWAAIEMMRLKRNEPSSSSPTFVEPYIPPIVDFSTEEAKMVFDALDEGATVVQCVRRLSLHPGKVESIAYSWARMSDTIVLDAETVRAINELPLDGTFPVTKASDILSILVSASKPTPCSLCSKRPSHVCRTCAIPFVRRQLETEARTRRVVVQPSEDADEMDEDVLDLAPIPCVQGTP